MVGWVLALLSAYFMAVSGGVGLVCRSSWVGSLLMGTSNEGRIGSGELDFIHVLPFKILMCKLIYMPTPLVSLFYDRRWALGLAGWKMVKRVGSQV